MKRYLSIPVIAALLYGVFAMLAAASTYPLMTRFAKEADISAWVFIAVPALLAGLFALLVYGRAAERVRTVGQSLSRGLLVAILTWIGFSALSTWVWCIPENYGECFRGAMMISGALAGGQLLLAALAAAAIMGYAIRSRAATWKAKD
ncbi:MAG: hypothetical protein IPM30_01070 [Burkholderiales bacterium]|jgi:membrane protease YdiL (CAAX protease family)|nr:hypothetical protein [Burkholderiales bacterium]